MLRLLLTLFTVTWLCAAHVAMAQHGTITYQERFQFEVDLPPELRQLAGDIPTETITQRQLFFDENRSLMRAAPKEDEQLERPDRRGFVIFFSGGPGQDEDVVFTDREANLYLEQRNLLGRTFLIEDTLEVFNWRLTGEQATFLGYLTMQAIAQTSDTTSVEAWFTPQIPASVGPFHYGGLPGVILVLTDGSLSLVAQSIEIDAPDTSLLQPPTSGRRVTTEEFEALVEERAGTFGPRVRTRGRSRN